MSEKYSLEVDLDFINKLYMLAEQTTPEIDEINLDALKQLVDDIEKSFHILKMSGKAVPAAKFYESKKEASIHDKAPENVLIVDDLCIITYQLGVLFKNLGYHVTVAKDIYDAVDKFKKFDFNLVILDLFLPTDKEGLILLDELVKLKQKKSLESKIGVITASSKKEHKEICVQKGADFYVEKTEDWQKNLIIAAGANQE